MELEVLVVVVKEVELWWNRPGGRQIKTYNEININIFKNVKYIQKIYNLLKSAKIF